MANSNLYGKASFLVPNNVLKGVHLALQKYGNVNGSERAMNLLKSPKISYSLAKRIKNFFDNYTSAEGNVASFDLYGGKEMHNWLNTVLGGSRNAIMRTKTVKANAGMDNQFIKNHEKNHIKPTKVTTVSSMLPKMKRMELFESVINHEGDNIAAICIVFNGDGKFLLVKRHDQDDWMPTKWALVGGGVEVGEDIEDAVAREIKEETNLAIKGTMFAFEAMEDDNKVYVFMAKCDKPEDIVLDESEHSEFAWVSIDECKTYDTVPKVAEYVVKALKTMKDYKKEKPTA
jgi:8-oxo-dGTP diphosphatase